ncbi:ArsR/SmtB family transcription factor [Antrihabitans stalagmiti]|nr:helix-turn-helix domain-containing protein [Antrihabitans stalagmiti]
MPDQLGHPDRDEMELGKVLAALADPHRRKVVTDFLAGPDDAERTCTSFNLPVSKSTLTHHFRILREAGLVLDADYGNRRGITLRRADLDERFPGLMALLENEARHFAE